MKPWRNPLGVAVVYGLVKKEIPDVRLLLVASMGKDDSEAWTYCEKTAYHAERLQYALVNRFGRRGRY